MRRDTHRGWAYEGRGLEPIELPLAREATIEVRWRGGGFSVHGSPSDLEAFAAGHLVAEGLVRSVKDITAISVEPLRDERIRIDLELRGTESVLPFRRDNVIWGVDSRSVSAANPGPRTAFSPEAFLALARDLHEREKSLRDAGPFHWAALYEPASRGMLLASDLSRHSAVDKVLGKALQSNIPLTNWILYSSGRVGEEMVAKAIRTGVEALATRSVAFSSAVDLAEGYGLVLVGKLNPDGYWVYAGRERLRAESDV